MKPLSLLIRFLYIAITVKSLLPAIPAMICPSSSFAGSAVIIVPGSSGLFVFLMLIGIFATLAG